MLMGELKKENDSSIISVKNRDFEAGSELESNSGANLNLALAPTIWPPAERRAGA